MSAALFIAGALLSTAALAWCLTLTGVGHGWIIGMCLVSLVLGALGAVSPLRAQDLFN